MTASAQGQRVGLAPADIEEMIAVLTDRTEAVVAEVSAQLPDDFPMDVADAIFSGMRRQSRTVSAK